MSDINPNTPQPPKKNRLWLILGIIGGGLVLLCICGVVAIGALTMMGSRVSSVFEKINTSLDTTPLAISTGADETPLAVIGTNDATETPLAVIGADDATETPIEPTSGQDDATPTADTVDTTSDGTVFTATDGQSQITGPNAWRDLPDLNKSAELHVGNKVQEQYLIVLTEDKSTANVKDLTDYAGLVRDGFTTNFPNAEVSEPRDLTINGMPATQYQVRATVEHVAITYWFTAVEGQNNFFQVIGWTLQDDEEKNRDVIQQAIASFEEIAK